MGALRRPSVRKKMEPKSTALADIVMTTRLRNALTNPGRYPDWEKKLKRYDRLEDLIGVTYHTIYCRPYFGTKSIAELQGILREHGWETQTKNWWDPFILPKPNT